jgi:hypothetical protein
MGKASAETKPKADAKLVSYKMTEKELKEFLRFKANKSKPEKAEVAPSKKKAAAKKKAAPAKSKSKVSDAEMASFLKLKQLYEQEGDVWKD